MMVPDDLIFACFVVTCVTAPTIGIVLGGWIVQRFGGYQGKHSITFVFVFACISTAISFFITRIDDLGAFAPLLWLFFFFGGGLVPNLVGIIH